ncbi:YjdF family protein [Fictibacillus sp. Mic-4]|uniref:YjdF family protein n=1 Tax=Fictibacillus TaxID=1329200 RepID=UPI0003FA8732|nr:YjdF family protein [Fictibacillus gelatini]
MKLTVMHDGQFWVGIIEKINGSNLKVYRYVFGPEPSDPEVLSFVNYQLLPLIEQSNQKGISVTTKEETKRNPKRAQREAAKELKKKGVTSQAQEAMRIQIEQAKKERKTLSRLQKEALNERKREIKRQKAKAKHRGK